MTEKIDSWMHDGHPCRIELDGDKLMAYVDEIGYEVRHRTHGLVRKDAVKTPRNVAIVRNKINKAIEEGRMGSNIFQEEETQKVKFVVEQ